MFLEITMEPTAKVLFDFNEIWNEFKYQKVLIMPLSLSVQRKISVFKK